MTSIVDMASTMLAPQPLRESRYPPETGYQTVRKCSFELSATSMYLDIVVAPRILLVRCKRVFEDAHHCLLAESRANVRSHHKTEGRAECEPLRVLLRDRQPLLLDIACCRKRRQGGKRGKVGRELHGLEGKESKELGDEIKPDDSSLREHRAC